MTDIKPLGEMTDEEITNISPEDYVAAVAAEQGNESTSPEGSGEEGQSAGDSPDEDNREADAGGAASDDGSSDGHDVGAGTTSAEGEDEGDGADSSSAASDDTSQDDQSGDQGESGDAESSQEEAGIDYKAEYEKFMAPFKAAKRMVALNNVDDARRLLQMGVDYSRKMADIKPHMKVLRTLEKANLLDPSRINFLIDLDAKNPEAIKKLLKEADIDPLSVDLEGSENYSSPDRMISDAELDVRDVLDNIQHSPKFQETVDVITKVMDTKSRQMLQDSPEVIAALHEQIEAGVYHKVQDQVANERMLGRLTGLSDLQAYYQVGDAMFKAGAFDTQPGQTTSKNEDSSQASAQGSGSGTSKEENLRDRRRAAQPSRGAGGKGGKPVIPDFSKMTDEEIENFDVASLP